MDVTSNTNAASRR